MIAGLCLIIGLAGLWCLGAALVRILATVSQRWRGEPLTLTRCEYLGAGLALGLGLGSWLLMVWCLAGGTLGRVISLLLAGVGGALLFAVRRNSTVSFPPLRPVSTSTFWYQIAVGLIFCGTFVLAILKPQHLWDERAIFGIKSVVIFNEGTICSPLLRDPDFVQGHPRYPLLVPLAEANVYELLGEVNDRFSKVVFPLMFLALQLNFAGVLKRHTDEESAWLYTLLLATVPSLFPWEYSFSSGQADAPLACFHGLSVLYLWDFLRQAPLSPPSSLLGRGEGRHGLTPRGALSLLFAGLFGGLAAFTKDEGLAFLLVDVAVFSVLVLVRFPLQFRTGLLSIACYLFAVILILMPWLWHRRSLPTTNEMSYFSRMSAENLAAGLQTLNWSSRHLLSRMFRESSVWGLHWWGVLLAAVTYPRRVLTRPQLLLLADMAGAVAGLLTAGMLAPLAVEDHLGGSSHRFLLQLVPTAVLFIAGQWMPTGVEEQAQ
ncbi:hypothetical protein [Planctomicrobium piriforme]|uniref:Glycosyltransferase RgtA/B/C/D-like domain-containing protein n=1 Tax=Planctomicrobium piriforme TaxID=1576369 RepID=A0A1I3EQ08_9PLAN|nr:hypothetical protein [Planctomicrobium piriforme]SFI00953.1 hypothetical protein SAMN05421753_104320 [Planctomicrobium piriforme]